jgi:hypothetical protein
VDVPPAAVASHAGSKVVQAGRPGAVDAGGSFSVEEYLAALAEFIETFGEIPTIATYSSSCKPRRPGGNSQPFTDRRSVPHGRFMIVSSYGVPTRASITTPGLASRRAAIAFGRIRSFAKGR